jgi:hypothetical protein
MKAPEEEIAGFLQLNTGSILDCPLVNSRRYEMQIYGYS